jgi:NAD(P)-dependent dehydrogenase (short-subunit alcohol dehydrogenase family)
VASMHPRRFAIERGAIPEMADGYIIVTGASRGIGAAIARELAGLGGRVAGLSRSGATSVGEGFVCDVSDEASIVAAVSSVAARGTITGLVNNAGLYVQHRAENLSAADFEGLMRINATSVVVMSRAVYPHLQRAGGGLIVNIGSYYDKLGVPRALAYCASKAAIGAITRCLAVEWARDSIRVIDVAPGYIATDLNAEFRAREAVQRWVKERIPPARPGTPEEVAKLVGTLFTSDIAFLTGETIYLDGGQSVNL